MSRSSGSAGPSSHGDVRRARRPGIPWGLVVAGLVWLLWVANFNDLRFGSIDADRPYSFLRRMFGETNDFFGYQFGLAFLWSPFYAVGKLLKAAGLETIEGQQVGIAMITIGTSLLVAVTCVLLLPVLRRLDLSSHEGLVLLAAVFGTPLFYYGSFKTGLSHVVDTLLVTVLIVLVHRWAIAERWSPWLAVAIGAVGGCAVSVRSFQGFVVLAIVLGLAFYRDYRAAVTAALVSAVTYAALASVPLLLGVDSLTSGYDSNTSEAVSRTFEFSPDTLARMLFSRYGLFVWTPVTLLGLIGFVLLLAWRRDARPFLVLTAGVGLAILLPYVFVPFFTPGYSQRYLTQLFPIVVIGLAALVESRARVAVPVVIVAAVWSVSLAFYGEQGLEYTDDATGFPRRVVSGEITPSEYAHAVFHRARLLDLLPDPFADGEGR